MTPTQDDRTQGPEVIYQPTRDGHSLASNEPARVERATAVSIVGGSSLEAIGGAGAVVLAIIALTGFHTFFLTAIATIAIGGALLAHGASVAARWNDTIERAGSEGEHIEVVGGMGTEVLGGAAGVVLGILALVGVLPILLVPIAAIVFGGATLLGAPAQPELARFAATRDRRGGRATYQAVEATSGAMALAGVGAAVLGILALLSVGPAIALSAVAMLVVGGSILVSGTALAARFGRTLAH